MLADQIDRLRPTVLGPYLDRIAELTQPALRIHPRRVDLASLPRGASRFGGGPDLPTGFTWPDWLVRPFECTGEPDDTPVRARGKLNFLAQLDLAEAARLLPELGLPPVGWLYFFFDADALPWGFDPADRDAARVLYHAGPAADLVRHFPPRPPPDPSWDFPCCALDFLPVRTLPDGQTLFKRFVAETPGAAGEACRESDAAVGSTRQDQLYAVLEACDEAAPIHQLRGCAHPLHDPMELECQLVANGVNCGSPDAFDTPRARHLAAGAADWQLLLQLDSDTAPGFEWCDVGLLYFWIRRQDLAAQRFDRTWTILQCC